MLTKYLYRSIVLVGMFVFCVTQLSGCGFVGRKFVADGAPSDNVDVSKIPDAVPKAERLSLYGNKDYVVEGRRYHVLKNAKGYCKVGYASWYGTKFHGQLTSTRERYNVYSMTAASPELPLPTYVQVTNLSNNKQVIVKVNDRGPFRSNRIMDFSYAAAKKLGFAGCGTARVRVVAIDPNTWNQPQHHVHVAATPLSGYYLQVGAFSKLTSAQNLSRKVSAVTDKPVHIAHGANLYRVQVGPLSNTTQCDNLKQHLSNNGFGHLLMVKI